jgi:hypothetical protein
VPAPSEAYLVTGATGEYDDYGSWVVAVTLDKVAADELCATLEAAAEHKKHGRTLSLKEQGAIEERLRAAGDPNARVDYTGAYYSVETAKFLG